MTEEMQDIAVEGAAFAKKIFDDVREFSKDPVAGVSRQGYSAVENKVHEYVKEVGKTLGLEEWADAAGNLFLTLPGEHRDLPAFVTGSHGDSVPQGGNYDGLAGIVAGLTVLWWMRRTNYTPYRDMSARDQICHHSAQHNAENRKPVDVFGHFNVLVLFTIHEEAHHQNDADRRQRTVEDIQPAGEIPVQPDRKHGADNTGNQHHRLLSLAENVRQTQTRRVQCIIVRGPDVETEDQNRQIEQTEVDHNLKNVIAADVDRRNTAEEKHQRVADKERDNARKQ